MFYADTNVLSLKEKKYLENFESDRYLFRIYNADRPDGHSANLILRNDSDPTPYAVRCNCGKYHPVVLATPSFKEDELPKSRTKVEWSPAYAIQESKQSNVSIAIKLMWQREGF